MLLLPLLLACTRPIYVTVEVPPDEDDEGEGDTAPPGDDAGDTDTGTAPLDDTGPGPDDSGETGEAPDTDTDTGGLCSAPWGSMVGNFQATYPAGLGVLPGQSILVNSSLTGAADVCAVSCDASWAEAMLSYADMENCSAALPLPYRLVTATEDPAVTACFRFTPASGAQPGATATCTIETSAGTLMLSATITAE